MQKVYINKVTNMVEQILPITEKENYPDDYYSWCYAVPDKEDKIKTYNLKYNIGTKEFEVVDGIPEFDEPIVEHKKYDDSKIDAIIKENKELRAEIDEIKKMMTSYIKEI